MLISVLQYRISEITISIVHIKIWEETNIQIQTKIVLVHIAWWWVQDIRCCNPGTTELFIGFGYRTAQKSWSSEHLIQPRQAGELLGRVMRIPSGGALIRRLGRRPAQPGSSVTWLGTGEGRGRKRGEGPANGGGAGGRRHATIGVSAGGAVGS